MTGLILWDFDGTLALRSGEVGWSRLLVEVVDDHDPEHALTAESFAPLLRSGFPWHQPELPHPELCTPASWWGLVEGLLANAYKGVGYGSERAKELAAHAHRLYVDPNHGWTVFDDVVPVLTKLSNAGWTHGILSNHVPELRALVDGLRLDRLVSFVQNSAETGYEKPHPEAFAAALGGHDLDHAWMVGDNFVADVTGAEAAGLRAVLVRRRHAGAARFSPDLWGVASFLEAA